MTAQTTESTATRQEYWALRELPPFPAVAMRLLQLASNQDSDVKEMIELLRTDAALSAELLRQANSALYGLSAEVSGLRHAVLLMGFDRVKSLALTISMGGYLKKPLRMAPLRRCWRHSLATALIAEKVMQTIGREADRAYTAGLLHDIGLLGLMVNYPHEYSTMLLVAQEHSFDLLATEEALFDLNHCEAGAWLAKQWKFPDEICQVTSTHHRVPGPQDNGLTAEIYWSARAADALGFTLIGSWFDGEQSSDVYARLLEELPGRWRKALPEKPEAFGQEITGKINGLD